VIACLRKAARKQVSEVTHLADCTALMRAPNVPSEVVLCSDCEHRSSLRLLHKLLGLQHGDTDQRSIEERQTAADVRDGRAEQAWVEHEHVDLAARSVGRAALD
jgi:hypothetical protein